ncbi:TetR/AcrR family transcriptional regulator [Catenuloplanes atrovinosus]|uniref:AcrR family transcriptional regulator n=1 Tax=Catenuloplanes atrovinosus TaxID=137266 RepID=A0AAE3YTC7_9ACTN|nr:helix-turn-helix domain-containing protein [Catenuloplanes atrovinosus]MDR7279499.1 AcrR family transcriptional regulator [Catenuloplanes atrovinosus]
MTEKPLRADAARNRARILAVAAEVFAAKGPAAGTEEIAARAGVAIGTVFRHFPTKDALLAAIMKDTRDRLAALATTAATLEDFFTAVVAEAAAAHTVATLLSTDVTAGPALESLTGAVAALLSHDQEHARVRRDVRLDEVMALLTATSQGALTAAWPADLQARTLAVVFAGLRP